MSEYYFGLGRGRVSAAAAKKIDRIALKHQTSFTRAQMPGEGWRFWFSTRNYGDPFNGATERAVWADLDAAGLANANGLVRS